MLSYGLVIVSLIVSLGVIGGFITRGGHPINNVDTKNRINAEFIIFFIRNILLKFN